MAASKGKPATESDEKRYQVQWLLSHDGNDFKAGDFIDLTDDELATDKVKLLLTSGVITFYTGG